MILESIIQGLEVYREEEFKSYGYGIADGYLYGIRRGEGTGYDFSHISGSGKGAGKLGQEGTGNGWGDGFGYGYGINDRGLEYD